MTGCTQFNLGGAMETRNCTVRDIITAVRWEEMTLAILGCIWKCKPLPNSRYETKVSSESRSYHDAVQRAAYCFQLPTLQFRAFEGLNVGIVLRHTRLCVEKLNNYRRLLILIFVFAIYKSTLFYLVDFYILCICLVFICCNREVFLELEPTL
jgi:hypothetical protein